MTGLIIAMAVLFAGGVGVGVGVASMVDRRRGRTVIQVPTGILVTDMALTDEEADRFRREWLRLHGHRGGPVEGRDA